MLDASGTSPQRPVLEEPIPQRPGSGIQDPFHTAVLCLNSDKVSPWKPDETTREKPGTINESITPAHKKQPIRELHNQYGCFPAQSHATLSVERIKGATSRFAHLGKFSLSFSSSSFAIRVYILHP